LEIKRKAIENYIEKGLYPYSRFYLQGIKKMRSQYFANHFSTIGLVGMNEALLNFIGESIASKRGRSFTLEVLDFMRKRLVKYQKDTGNLYNLEQTPAEGTSFRLSLQDKKIYPDIITAGTKKVPYYTNSTQLPVNFTDDIFEALKLQDEIQCKYTGGSVLHLFLGERVCDIETAKKLIKKVFEQFHLPYTTLTPTFSICPVHGYLSGKHFECPKCTVKQPCEVYSRVVGYIRPVGQYHIGKQREFSERKTFKIPKAL
jgi:ribonucleoside-triphosphate reductase